MASPPGLGASTKILGEKKYSSLELTAQTTPQQGWLASDKWEFTTFSGEIFGGGRAYP